MTGSLWSAAVHRRFGLRVGHALCAANAAFKKRVPRREGSVLEQIFYADLEFRDGVFGQDLAAGEDAFEGQSVGA